jgi:protein TonB
VTETKIVKGLCDQCDKNVVDLLEKMPRWFPAKENGKALKTKMIIPISFSL